MKNIKTKDIERLIKGADAGILATQNGCILQGHPTEVMTLYTLITKQLAEDLDKKLLEHAFELAFKEPDELLGMVKEALETLKEKLEKKEN